MSLASSGHPFLGKFACRNAMSNHPAWDQLLDEFLGARDPAEDELLEDETLIAELLDTPGPRAGEGIDEHQPPVPRAPRLEVSNTSMAELLDPISVGRGSTPLMSIFEDVKAPQSTLPLEHLGQNIARVRQFYYETPTTPCLQNCSWGIGRG